MNSPIPLSGDARLFTDEIGVAVDQFCAMNQTEAHVRGADRACRKLFSFAQGGIVLVAMTVVKHTIYS